MDFKSMKKSSKEHFEKLTKEIEKLKKGSFEKDPRFWEPTLDKAGNSLAIIRFLPAGPKDDLPYVRVFKHSFKGPNGWFIENCLTSLGRGTDDPACEENNKLWETKVKANQEIASKRKRNQVYTSNILVLQDKANPEAEGKNFLFNYGVKIWDKCDKAVHPEEGVPDEPFNPFDFWAGADFMLKVKRVGDYRNYDDSKFLKQAPVYKGNDKQLEELWSKLYTLNEFIQPDKFKSYDELRTKLFRVLGTAALKPTDISTPHEENSMNPNWDERHEAEPADPENQNFFQDLIDKD